MTTKWKIITGFICMIVISGVMSSLGYVYLNKSMDGLIEYGRLARLNVKAGKALTGLIEAANGTNTFLNSRDPAAMSAAVAALDEMDKTLAEAQKEMVKEESIAAVERFRASARAYREDLRKIADETQKVREQYQGTVVPESQKLSEAVGDLSGVATKVNNTPMIQAVERFWREYAFMLSALGRFYYGREEADRTILEQRIAALKPLLREMEGYVVVPAGREMYGRMNSAALSVFGAVEILIQGSGKIDKVLAESRIVRASLSEDLHALSTYYDKGMTEGGAAITGESKGGQTMLLVGSALGLLLGSVLAVFILSGLVRVLRGMSAFADAIANGDFHAQVNSREKGEIGQMLASMRRIPQVLEKLINAMRDSSGRILVGEYRTRIDAASFSGAFTTLAASVNTVCGAYTKILDTMPVAIFTADANKRILYANDFTQKVLGGENKGMTCGSCLNTAHCNTSDCFAVKAMQAGGSVSGEVAIKPATGMSLEISVVALPLIDESGAARGFMEICSDITESKKRQRVISSVTEQAASISTRVAAASEQLSAQVEQVSRGAEMQRDRVVSTASAMTEMNSTVLEVARNAGQASEQSELTRHKAHDGASLVDNVVQSINQVNVVASALQANMRELGAKAESVGGVMNVIADIADQTNLLALNAAIEAARAGDAGRGFAVVADEVRKLAEKTMSATQEVGANIASIQDSTRSNIDEVNEAARAINEATALANSSGQALAEIVTLASASSSVVASIATAAEEQSATSEEINRAIEEINRIVCETTDGMAQSSSAVQELAVMAQELNTVMAGLQ